MVVGTPGVLSVPEAQIMYIHEMLCVHEHTILSHGLWILAHVRPMRPHHKIGKRERADRHTANSAMFCFLFSLRAAR
jgi:hypothetical protein